MTELPATTRPPLVPVVPLTIASPAESLAAPRTLQLTSSGGSGATEWVSLNTFVATVSESGLVTARFPGAVTIAAGRGGSWAGISLRVVASGLELATPDTVMTVYDVQQLRAHVLDADGARIAGAATLWSSSNPAIATVVRNTGLVTAIGIGSVTLTVDGAGISKAVRLRVAQMPTKSFDTLLFSAIATAGNYACGIEHSGILDCWGDNHSGALGVGIADGYPPFLVQAGTRMYSALSVGSYTNCAIEAVTGFGYCWALNRYGQVGDGTLETRFAPTLIAGGALRFRSLSTSGDVTCGVELNANVGYCWGLNNFGQLGDRTRTNRSVPALVGDGAIRFTIIAAGEDGACGLEVQTSHAYCWGDNGLGQVGDGTREMRTSPVLVADGAIRFSSISTGKRSTCGIEADSGTLYCWGWNDFGQLGDGTTRARSRPAPVSGGRRYRSVSVGTSVACALESETELALCWGAVVDGATNRLEPTMVNGGLRYSAINAGGDAWEMCGVQSTTSRGFCWDSQLEPQPLRNMSYARALHSSTQASVRH